ncbi:MAG: amino acid carrier protein [Phycisphaeraceae bacterium]|nr:MAG: amino acid carrier protein [Phycisphaeraceae bacterium]
MIPGLRSVPLRLQTQQGDDMERFNAFLQVINGVIWHDYVLYVVLATGVLFTIWSGFSQYRALTHGASVIRGKYDDKNDPGAINHFQALSTALSATVGLGNIAGVAIAIALGGPGAVFWMWMVGIFGMALKTTEVTLSMLSRNTDDPDNPHGGPMWVAKHGFTRLGLAKVGGFIGGLFCITLLISAITGGNMFQAFNVAEITHTYFPTIPKFVCGVVLAIVVGLVIIGGIKRIGNVAARIVPLMCALYLIAAIYVVAVNIGEVPAMIRMIFVAAFTPSEAAGAFLGGTAAYAFLWGMKRALFSSEAGQGSAPIAHSAAKTDEPVREGVVAGLEPFIDTIVVCTLTTLVILLSGAWNREAESNFLAQHHETDALQIVMVNETVGELTESPQVQPGRRAGEWTLTDAPVSDRAGEGEWSNGDSVFGYLLLDPGTGPNEDGRLPISGSVVQRNGVHTVTWRSAEWPQQPTGVAPTLFEGSGPTWTIISPPLPQKTTRAREIHRIEGGQNHWRTNETVFMVVRGDINPNTGRELRRISGAVMLDDDGQATVDWNTLSSITRPTFQEQPDGELDLGLYGDFIGAALTGHAFDRVMPGLGMWLVTIAAWLFAISTMISWSYYGEQGIVYLLGDKAVMTYKLLYCALIIVATLGFIRTEDELDNLTALGTGVMLWVNIPIMLIFGYLAMRAYHNYIGRLKSGELDRDSHPPAPITDVVEGKDVE